MTQTLLFVGVAVVALSLSARPAMAQEPAVGSVVPAPILDGASEQALHKTQDLLTNPGLRRDNIQKDANAAEVDKHLDSMGAKNEEKGDIYQVASDVFENMVKEAEGDPIKMQALILEAQKNPQAFYENHISKTQQEKIRSIAGKIDQGGPKVQP